MITINEARSILTLARTEAEHNQFIYGDFFIPGIDNRSFGCYNDLIEFLETYIEEHDGGQSDFR